jgi:hypothetical protein
LAWDNKKNLALWARIQTELDISSDDLNRQFVRRIQESEVKDALKRMKGGKAMGPDGIRIEAWRSQRRSDSLAH